MQLRNRIVCLPHGLNFAQPGVLRPTARHRDYYAARARGGVGLVCVESTVCSWDGQPHAHLVLSGDPECIPGYREIVDAVHAGGARISGQITHFGLEAAEALTRQPLIAPSDLPDPLTGVCGRPMTAIDMERVSGDFVAAANNLSAAGFDAVELKLAHDGLLRQFMSPLTNDRSDRYGGGTRNRLRFPLEVLSAVRAAVPSRVALGVRLVVDECLPGGYGLDEGVEFGRLIDSSGLVDYISCDVGTAASIAMVVPPMAVEEGYAEEAFTRLSRACGTPVIAFGQIRTPAYAERILAEGRAAAVGMSRQMLADPEWAAKALAGQPERIRPCTSCNQLCLGEAGRRRPIGCTINPYAGFGEHRPPHPAIGTPRRIVVVGGGPAGMEAARVAAEDGHQVELFEARAQLGGQLGLAAQTRGRERWADYLGWLESEIRRIGVAVSCGRRLDAERVLELAPDHLIIATGSLAVSAPAQWGPVVGVDDYLAGAPPAAHIVLLDAGPAGPPLWMTALECADRGAETVTVVSRAATLAGDLDAATSHWVRSRFAELSIRWLPERAVSGADPAGVTVTSIWGGADEHLPADLVIAVTRRQPASAELVESLGSKLPVTVIGDALVPRDASAAIREGQQIGSAIGADGAAA